MTVESERGAGISLAPFVEGCELKENQSKTPIDAVCACKGRQGSRKMDRSRWTMTRKNDTWLFVDTPICHLGGATNWKGGESTKTPECRYVANPGFISPSLSGKGTSLCRRSRVWESLSQRRNSSPRSPAWRQMGQGKACSAIRNPKGGYIKQQQSNTSALALHPPSPSPDHLHRCTPCEFPSVFLTSMRHAQPAHCPRVGPANPSLPSRSIRPMVTSRPSPR